MTIRAAAIVLAVLLVAVAPARAAESQQAVEEALTCQCGCGLTVHSCNHLQCPSGEPMKKEIGERLARGETKEQILAVFRQRFGEKVLSSPTFSGFNWLAWVTPFAAVLAAIGVLSVVLGRRGRAAAPAAAPAVATGDPALRAKLYKALADMDEDA